ncbi:unnamed protein product [Allacma fusca]|uniref:Uncharacterized protein n=1 Tax=Allacma fusca TaxID=39272 RepID=A0A8J2KWX3_9HEXA|nr:unnamed protein product [Allacma fusca]
MEKPSRKLKQNGKNDPVEKPLRKEELSKEGSGNQDEASDEDEVVNYPNHPPIQNGFVVFIHQLNLATTAKEKRTVVEWISDALKMLDIIPEIITVDKLMEQSIATCSKPKVPIIKFSRPTAEMENATTKDNGNSSKPNRVNAKITPSKKKIKIDKSKTVSAAPVTTGQSPLVPTWKGGKVIPQKPVTTSSSKSLQRKSGRPVKLHQMEDKKQEKSSEFRFKVRWIAAQAPRSLDQSVFSVVNDIVQTKNICFPECEHTFRQMKGPRRKDKDTTPDGKHKHGKMHASKTMDVEILHKTMSSQFDVSSYASFDIDQIMKISEASTISQPPVLDNSLKAAFGQQMEETEMEKQKPPKKPPPVPDNHGTQKQAPKPHVNNSESNETGTTKSSESSSLFEIRSTNKNYTTLYNTAVQMALISTNNPFASPYTRTDLPDFHGLPIPGDLKKRELTLTTTLDANGNEVFGISSASKSVVVVIRDLTKSKSGLAMLLKNMLRREGIRSYTISVSDLLSQPKALELMESFAVNGGYDPARDETIGCKILIQKGLDYKLAENRHSVVIVDVADETFVRMWSVYNYGVKLGHKCLILEKKPDGVFENNLKRVFITIRRRFKRRNLCTWPSNRHSATTASSDDFVFKPESLHKLGNQFSLSKQAILAARSVRFAVNVSKLEVFSELARMSTNCILQNENQTDVIREDANPTRGIKSASCLQSHGESIDGNLSRVLRSSLDRKYKHAELPDILGGTAAISMEKITDGDNFSDQPNLSQEEEEGICLLSADDFAGVISDSEDSDDSDDNGMDTLDESGTTVKSHSHSDNSSVDSNFLAALKESALVDIQDGTDLPEFSKEYPAGGPDTDDDTDISVSKSREPLQAMRASLQNSQRLYAYQDADNSTTWDEDQAGGREIHPNKIVSRTSLGKNRKSLLEIHRCKNKNRTGATTSSASDENLFKGWVALPGKDPLEKKNGKGFFLRTHYRLTGLLHRICTCGKKMSKKK